MKVRSSTFHLYILRRTNFYFKKTHTHFPFFGDVYSLGSKGINGFNDVANGINGVNEAAYY